MALAGPAAGGFLGGGRGGSGRRRERGGEKGVSEGVGASGQGGAGGAGRGGWVHVADERKAVDFGRIAEPEDIFGSVEVAPDGGFVWGRGDGEEEGFGEGDGRKGKGEEVEGNFQWSGTYRVVTREGM